MKNKYNLLLKNPTVHQNKFMSFKHHFFLFKSQCLFLYTAQIGARQRDTCGGEVSKSAAD